MAVTERPLTAEEIQAIKKDPNQIIRDRPRLWDGLVSMDLPRLGPTPSGGVFSIQGVK